MLQPLNVGQDQHSAFPCVYKRPGALRLLWRQGSDHYAQRDGVVKIATSFDEGFTWEAAGAPIRKYPDYRDPCGNYIDGVEVHSWFGGNPSNEALGMGVQREWWDYSRRVDNPNEVSHGASCAPIVKLPDGRLGAAFYARKPGESLYTAWMGWSSDNGWSWQTNRIVNMLGAGRATPEPYLVINGSGSMTYFFFRWGQDDGIGVVTSSDSGKTWHNNATPVKVLENATGRPTTIVTSSGRLVMIYRERPSRNAVLVHSLSGMSLASWSSPQTLLQAPTAGGIGMTYASMVEISPNVLYVVCGMEAADGSSKLYGNYVAVPA